MQKKQGDVMGELMDYLQSRKARILVQISQAQNFDLQAANAKIAKIDAMITKLQNNPSWDV